MKEGRMIDDNITYFSKKHKENNNNFKMNEIKSYLSLESIPSQQFQTPPPKASIQTMQTNNSLSFSNTMGSLDTRSGKGKALYRSNDLFKNISYQTRDYVEQQDQIDNESAVTLSPAVTNLDLHEIVNVVKMVAFMSRQTQERQVLIEKKSKAIKELQNKIYLLEQRVGFQKKEFQKKEKVFKSRSLSIHKYKKKNSESIKKEIMEMKLEINQMKRWNSSKKLLGGSRQNMEIEGRKSKGNVNKNEKSKKQKIYIPIPIPGYINQSLYPQIPLTQRQSRQSQYLSFHQNQNYYQKNQSGKDHSVCYSNQHKHSQHQFGSFGKRTISNDMNIMNSQKKTNENEMSGRKILDIIQQKLLMDFNIQNRETRPRSIIELTNNPQIMQPNQQKTPLQILGLESKDFHSNVNTQTIHINVIKEGEREPNLDYFHDDVNEEIRQSQKSRKSLKNPRQTKGMTNTWKKDEEDEQIVQLLKKSISQQPQRQKQKMTLKPPQKRSELGAKLIITNMAADQSFDMALPQKSRQQILGNSSQVQILVDNSEQKSNNSNNKSKQSLKKMSTKRQNIMNSSIGIVLHDMSDSQEQSPVKPQNKSRSPNKNAVSIVKKISIINQALEQSQPNTPIPQDIHPANNFNLQPSVQSRFTETVRQTNLKDAIEMIASRESIPQKRSSEQINTPPLSRPPSLLQKSNEVEQQFYEDDMINSIKLSADSKIIDSPSKLNQKSNIKVTNQQGEDDFLRDIRLVAMSRISREKNFVQRSSQFISQDNISIVDKMTFSEVSPTVANNNQQGGMDLIDSQLRQSSRSVIVKKGSAVQKSSNRQQSPSLKNSSKGTLPNGRSGSHLTGKSGQLSTPIQQQAQDEQDEFSTIVRKHKRNTTDLN